MQMRQCFQAKATHEPRLIHEIMSDYGKIEYWNSRYSATEGEAFDWYKSYDEVS
jgi:hypothetical protein